ITKLEYFFTQLKEENILADRGFKSYQKCEPVIDVGVIDEETILKALKEKILMNKI
ncbi:hypothetical protein KI387_016515, partial [Taxus chinensis]